jgi:DNA-binding transcriptional LysR family regulator
MELRHLRYFKALAELLNFSRAAEQLRVAQPSLSRQIKDLEEELGVRLLDRNRVRVQLTDAGRTFYTHTCKILAQVDIAVGSVREAVAGTSGEFIICNDWRLSHDFILGAISDFRACYPRVDVTLRDLHIHEQLAALRSRQVHLGFVIARELPLDGELESLSVLTSELVVAVNAKHPLANAERIRIADLAHETWVIPGEKESPGVREFVTQICRLSGFTPTFARPTQGLQGVLARVATGYGVGLLPDFLAATLRPTPLVRFVPCDCPPIELRAAWHRSEDSKLLQQFLAILRRRIGAALNPTESAPLPAQPPS